MMILKTINKLNFVWVLSIIFFTADGISQKQIATHNNAWGMYFGNHRLNEKWGLHTEYQWRRNVFFQSWQQSLLRIGLDYYVKNDLQFSCGYGWIVSFPYGKQPILRNFNEHRIWQQFILKNKISRLEFQHRYRLEQRFLENWKVSSAGNIELDDYLFRQRIRYRFLINIPINKPELIDNTLFLSIYDEIFLGFGKGIGKNVLDQNRLYFALGWKFNNKINVQLGYMNQYILKFDGIKQERNHTLQFGVTYNLDFRK